MKNKLLGLVLFLTMGVGFSAPAFAQCGIDSIKTAGSSKDILLYYSDPALSSKMLRRKASLANVEHTSDLFSNLKFQIVAEIFEGKKPVTDEPFVFIQLVNTLPERKYRWFHQVTLYLDGKEVAFGDPQRLINVSDEEVILIGMTYPQLCQLAAVKDVQGSVLFGTDFWLGGQDLCVIKAMKKFLDAKYHLSGV